MATRLISSGIGIAIALVILFLHNTFVFPLCIGIVSLITLFEFYHANDMQHYKLSFFAGLTYALMLPIISVGTATRFKLLLTVICSIIVLFDYILHQMRMKSRSFFCILAGMFLIPNALSTAVILNHSDEKHGIIYVVLALCGAWVADSSAYFTGTFLGKHKLCPNISPKKTIEGFFGGLLANVVVFILFTLVYAAIMKHQGTPITYSWFAIVMLALACGILGTIGDLSASVLKRQLDLKDYGNIMPGHGGILDRFDSVLLVLPFFCAYIISIGLFGT
ncbi:MAG: phosphatidate cytidylyltransferase [Oscillospiraceae bacterium]|nr:phosphatidate cytidylyltransferase [Oscillospiraceae bacterium]